MSRASTNARKIREFEQWIESSMQDAVKEHQAAHREFHAFAKQSIRAKTPRVTGKSRDSWEDSPVGANGRSEIGSSLPHMVVLEYGWEKDRGHKMVTRTIQDGLARFTKRIQGREFGAAVGRRLFG